MSKRAIIIPILVLGVAAVLLFSIKGYWTTWEGGGEQRTDDAYVRADMTPMSTRVSGTVKKVAVEDFETVTPGQPLVELDDADYKAMLAEAEAALAGAQASLANNQAAKRIQDAKVQNADTMVQQATAANRTADWSSFAGNGGSTEEICRIDGTSFSARDCSASPSSSSGRRTPYRLTILRTEEGFDG